MSARSLATQDLKDAQKRQDAARAVLRKAASDLQPDPMALIEAIAQLTISSPDAHLAIMAAQACVKARDERVRQANATTHLPDDEEWDEIVAYFGLDTSFQYDEARQLEYAREYRALPA